MCHLRCLTVFPKTRRFRRLRRPGSSRHRASPWAAPVPPTERAGSKESVLCCLSAASPPPLVAGATTDKRVLKIDGAFTPRVHCATACGGKVVRSTKGGGLWYRLTAMSIKCCLRQHPLWWLAPPPSRPLRGGTMGAGQWRQFELMAAAKRKPYNRASLEEMHPFWCCAPLPPEGEVCSPFSCLPHKHLKA